MANSETGLRRFALRIKPGTDAAMKTKIPRKLFLGVRFKATSSAIYPLPRPEDRK